MKVHMKRIYISQYVSHSISEKCLSFASIRSWTLAWCFQFASFSTHNTTATVGVVLRKPAPKRGPSRAFPHSLALRKSLGRPFQIACPLAHQSPIFTSRTTEKFKNLMGQQSKTYDKKLDYAICYALHSFRQEFLTDIRDVSHCELLSAIGLKVSAIQNDGGGVQLQPFSNREISGTV